LQTNDLIVNKTESTAFNEFFTGPQRMGTTCCSLFWNI